MHRRQYTFAQSYFPRLNKVSLWIIFSGIYLILYTDLSEAAYGSAPRNITFGVVINDAESVFGKAVKLAVDFAVEEVNADPTILPNLSLVPIFANVTNHLDTFESITAGCAHLCSQADCLQCFSLAELIRQGVFVIIGPDSSSTVKITQTLCQGMHVPQIAPSATDPFLTSSYATYPYLLKMSSPDSLQSTALYDLVIRMQWTRIAILTSSSDYGRHGLTEFQQLVSRSDKVIISSMDMFHAPVNASLTDARQQLETIIQKGTRIVVLNCLAEYARFVLRQAAQLGMMDKGWAWLVTDGITSVGSISNSCSDTPLHLRGLLGTRPSLGAGPLYKEFTKKWQNATAKTASSSQCCNINSLEYMGYAVRTYDSVLVMANGLHNFLNDGNNLTAITQSNASWLGNPRPQGKHLFKYLGEVSIPGAMNWLNFTNVNTPSVNVYDVVNLGPSTWIKVGSWTPTRTPALNVSKPDIHFMDWTNTIPSDFQRDLKNITIKVVTILEAPFVMENNESTAFPNKKYKGYCVDLLDLLQERLQFKYELHLVTDGNYGVKDPITNEWNGIVKEILQGKADLAIAPLTISYERSQVMAFTKPYMDLGLTILMGRSKPEKDMFAFLQPFNLTLWGAFTGFLCVAACCVWMCATLSPYGYRGRYAQRRGEKDRRWRSESMAMSFYESIHFAFAAIVSANTNAIPRCLSGRIIGNAWWLCVFFITSSYTANLAAFLTVARLDSGISSVEDLASQTSIKYGTVGSSNPAAFFERRITPTYSTMYDFMQSEETDVKNASQGIEVVRRSIQDKGNNRMRAFIFDSTILDYAAQTQPCDVMTVGRLFAKAGYGLAMRRNSPYLENFNQQVTWLRDQGQLEKLYINWFKGGCASVDSASTNSGGDQLDFTSMAGVFLCTVVIFAMGLIVLIGEFFVASYREKKRYTEKEDRPVTMSNSLKTRIHRIGRDCKMSCVQCWPKLDDVDDDVTEKTPPTSKIPTVTSNNGVIANTHAPYYSNSPTKYSHSGLAKKWPSTDIGQGRYRPRTTEYDYGDGVVMTESVRV